MNIVLVGYRGSGKTSVGRKLADRLWLPFIDIDQTIVHKAGKTIAQIFAEDGEEHFRELESAALQDALQLDEQVMALGGGTVIRAENRAALKKADCKVIYLRCDAEVLLKRVEADASSEHHRPHLTAFGGGLEEIKVKLAEREPLYREVMKSELDVTSLSVDETVVYITRML